MDDVGAGKLDDLDHFRSQWQRELKDKTKEEIEEKQATCEINDEEEEDDVHRKVSVSFRRIIINCSKHPFILIGKSLLYEGCRV